MEHAEGDEQYIEEIDHSIQSLMRNNHQLLIKQKQNSNIKRFRQQHPQLRELNRNQLLVIFQLIRKNQNR